MQATTTIVADASAVHPTASINIDTIQMTTQIWMTTHDVEVAAGDVDDAVTQRMNTQHSGSIMGTIVIGPVS